MRTQFGVIQNKSDSFLTVFSIVWKKMIQHSVASLSVFLMGDACPQIKAPKAVNQSTLFKSWEADKLPCCWSRLVHDGRSIHLASSCLIFGVSTWAFMPGDVMWLGELNWCLQLWPPLWQLCSHLFSLHEGSQFGWFICSTVVCEGQINHLTLLWEHCWRTRTFCTNNCAPNCDNGIGVMPGISFDPTT